MILASVGKIISKGIGMVLPKNAISEIRDAFKANSIKIHSFLTMVLRMTMLAILMSSGTACSGVPMIPGI